MATPLPVFLLTGFLGSGKTTLLSQLLRQSGFADTAVVVNELGEVGLDHVLLDRSSEDGIVLLDSGCLCCALGNSLQETLEDLHYRRARGELPTFARVVVETSGIADPGPIAATLALDRAIAHHYRLGGIVTTVDAVHGAEQLQRFPEAARQVAFADRLIVTKSDVAAPEATAALQSRLATINPHAPRLMAVSGAISADEVLVDVLASPSIGGVDDAKDRRPQVRAMTFDHAHDRASPDSAHPHDHVAAHGIATTTVRLATPLDWPRYADWVEWMQRVVGAGLLRVKGVVRMADGGACALHAVMRLFGAPAELAAMPEGYGNGVVILITQNVTAATLAEAGRRLNGTSAAKRDTPRHSTRR